MNIFRFSLIALLILPGTLAAQLPTRTEIVTDRYQKTRAQALMQLNERYLNAYQQELRGALSGNRLEEANSIKQSIQRLQSENKELNAILTGGAAAKGPGQEHPIVGKTAHFPHPEQEDFIIRVEFREEGEATWIGLNDFAVEWEWEKGRGGRHFYFWSPNQRTRETGWTIKVDEDGEKAEVEELTGGYRTDAEMKPTR